ncbi:MAG: hypothetical protein Q7I89_02595 [Syntrophales bacterium]|nr:hypothetical protein [Syntrophales bacterium]
MLSLFLKDETEEAEATLDFRKKETPQEIGGLLYSHLARKGIWAMHSGGFHFQGGHLTVGPSDCGKSTFSHMAMKNGLDLLSDDITLLRETPDGFEMLPFYSTMFLKDGMIVPEQERYKPATLKYLLLPKINNGSVYLKKVKKKIDLLRRLVPQFLWSYDGSEQKKQKRFLEKMCHYPAYEVYWSSRLFHDHTLLRGILDEVVQSEG